MAPRMQHQRKPDADRDRAAEERRPVCAAERRQYSSTITSTASGSSMRTRYQAVWGLELSANDRARAIRLGRRTARRRRSARHHRAAVRRSFVRIRPVEHRYPRRQAVHDDRIRIGGIFDLNDEREYRARPRQRRHVADVQRVGPESEPRIARWHRRRFGR